MQGSPQMGKLDLKYYVVKGGRGYWQPTKKVAAMGYLPRCLGRDGPEAWAEARKLYAAYRAEAGKKIASAPETAIQPNSIEVCGDDYI